MAQELEHFYGLHAPPHEAVCLQTAAWSTTLLECLTVCMRAGSSLISSTGDLTPVRGWYTCTWTPGRRLGAMMRRVSSGRLDASMVNLRAGLLPRECVHCLCMLARKPCSLMAACSELLSNLHADSVADAQKACKGASHERRPLPLDSGGCTLRQGLSSAQSPGHRLCTTAHGAHLAELWPGSSPQTPVDWSGS